MHVEFTWIYSLQMTQGTFKDGLPWNTILLFPFKIHRPFSVERAEDQSISWLAAHEFVLLTRIRASLEEQVYWPELRNNSLHKVCSSKCRFSIFAIPLSIGIILFRRLYKIHPMASLFRGWQRERRNFGARGKDI